MAQSQSGIPNVKESGLTVLYQPVEGAPCVDIVFVHGLNGHPRKTWEDEGTNFFWPWHLHKVFKDARIMTFGYDASIRVAAAKNLMGIHDYAVNLLGRLRNERAAISNSKTPLVFVCHSLGGLVVKEALVTSVGDPNYRTVQAATRAVFFFGTPHRGAAALDAKRLSLLINVARVFLTSLPGDLESALKVRSKELFTINDRFRNIPLLLDNTISITCFYERVETKGLGDVVVDQDSAVLGYSREEDVGLSTDHTGLVRFSDAEDDNYDFVTKTMLYKLNEILETGRTEQASTRLLGPFSSQMKLREKQTIPFLTWMNFYLGVPALGPTWSADFQVGTARLGRYAETWMNLLLIFGAESIVRSSYIDHLMVSPEELPQGLVNPFAMELSLTAILAGIAGCDEVHFDDDIPTFSGEGIKLEFTRGGPFKMIGKFSQQPGIGMYLGYAARTIARAALLAGGALFYAFNESLAAGMTMALSMPSIRIFDDLRKRKCPCSKAMEFLPTDRTGLRVPAFAFLTGDTPTNPRTFPSENCRLIEMARELSYGKSFWKYQRDRKTEIFRVRLGSIIEPVVLLSISEFILEPFQGDRFEKRTIAIERRERNSLKFIDLGFSWLAMHEDYRHEGKDRRIKERPQWSLMLGMSGFVLLEGIIEKCDTYLRTGDMSVYWEDSETKSFLHTCLACQLQEVDWWLGTRQSLAACETISLLKELPAFGTMKPEGVQTDRPMLMLLNERRVVRSMLIFRVLLMAMLLQLGLDNSKFEQENQRSKIVLLR